VSEIRSIQGRNALCIGDPQQPAPKHWQWVKLDEIARLESGHTPSRLHSEYWDGDIAWVGIKDARLSHGGTIKDTIQKVTQLGIANSSARLLPTDTVCLSRTASVGYVVVLGREMSTSQDFVNWVCSPALDPRFLQYLLVAEGEDILRFGKGSTHTTIYFEAAEQFRVCIPAINEQRRIVAKLDELLARSKRAKEELAAIPALLERYRQSVLAAAFRGDLTADWRAKHPEVESASELLKRIHVERRQRWEESELVRLTAKGKAPTDEKWKAKYEEPTQPDVERLTPLPATWVWTSMETVGDVHLGRQRAPQYQTGDHTQPYLRVANIKDDRIDVSDINSMDFDPEDFEHYRLVPGDVLLSEGQSPELVGQSAIYEGGIEGLCFQKTLHRFRRYGSAPSARFAQLVFRHYVRSGFFRSVASLTVNIAHLTLVRLKPLAFPLPPQAEQRVIEERLKLAMQMVDQLEASAEQEFDRSEMLERSILTRAFRGELVPQDPNDEPASVLLERIRAEHAAAPPKKPGRKPRSPNP
jgi:type I restriction enzyme S subunit